MTNTNKCMQCDEKLAGRVGQKFCSPYCKSAYHYKANKRKPESIYVKIDNALKQNRRILKHYNVTGQSQVKKSVLIEEGFNFKYETHKWKAKNGNEYAFCYEFGYRDLKDPRLPSGQGKYMLIMWQDYME